MANGDIRSSGAAALHKVGGVAGLGAGSLAGAYAFMKVMDSTSRFLPALGAGAVVGAAIGGATGLLLPGLAGRDARRPEGARTGAIVGAAGASGIVLGCTALLAASMLLRR